MAYARTTTVDAGAAGDTVKQAILDCDTDITGIFADLNTHEALTTNAHGFTGTKTGSGAMVGATSPTLTTPTLTGTVTLSSATMSAGTYTSPTLNTPTIVTPTITGTVTASSATITGGTYTNSAFVTTVSASTTDRAMTADDMCKVWTNTGASGTVIFTLPEASTVIGKSVTFVVTEAKVVNINPYDATDQIINNTNAAGDAIQNTEANIGALVKLLSVGNNSWVVLYSMETWLDVN